MLTNSPNGSDCPAGGVGWIATGAALDFESIRRTESRLQTF
jgi:hypothetical protein